MRYATLVREFLRELFGSRLVVQLQKDIDDLRKERDYFRGRAERLELMLYAPREKALNPVPIAPSKPRAPRTYAEALELHNQTEFAPKEPENAKVG